MKADVRFLGEYIVTGAFFWIAQLILCLALFGTDVILTKSGGPPLDVLERLKDYQVSLAALALVFLFFTGLMLDVFSTYVPVNRVGIFEAQWDDNSDWIKAMITEHEYFSEKDFGPEPHFRARLTSFDRLQSRMVSYIFVFSDALNLEPFLEETRLSRTTQSIAMASIFLYCESLLFLVLGWVSLKHLSPVTALLLYVFLFACIRAARHHYSRLCLTLFSLTYATAEKRRESKANAEPEPE
jgi:hypothetical protein